MRRKDRQVTDRATMEQILSDCKICRVAVADSQGLYIVPMNFGYVFNGDELTLYFHSAKEGRKADAFRAHPQVAFEMDCHTELVHGSTACQYSYHFQSITGNGIIAPVDMQAEKAQGLSAIMKQQTGKSFDFNTAMTDGVAVYALQASSFAGKQSLS